MILTVIVTALLEFALAALCFTAGCVYWDIECAKTPPTVCISEKAKKLLEKGNYRFVMATSIVNDNILTFWVRRLNAKDPFDTPLIRLDPEGKTIDVLK